MNVCPDCAGGEHHPDYEVTTLNMETNQPGLCECLCAEPIIGPTQLVPGETGHVFAGRYVDRNLHVHAVQGYLYVGAIIDYNGNIKIVHVPTSWVRRIES